MRLSICKICKVQFYFGSDRTGIYCTMKCRNKDATFIAKKGNWSRIGKPAWNKNKECPKGEKSNHWLGDKVKYPGIHQWLAKTYGKANKCEHIKCKKISERYQWAKLKNKLYERKRENFWQLCSQCHINYDDITNRGWITRKKND